MATNQNVLQDKRQILNGCLFPLLVALSSAIVAGVFALVQPLAPIIWNRLFPPPHTVYLTYNFERGGMGWRCKLWSSNYACSSVIVSNELFYEGAQALKVSMDLVGPPNVGQNSKGEILVEIPGEPRPLLNHVITFKVYSPPDAVGDPNNPNGYQIFVRDNQYRNLYSCWHNITAPGQWIDVSLTVQTNDPGCPKAWLLQPGFDPDHVTIVGLKMGAGNSTLPFNGDIYVDEVTIRPPGVLP